MTAQGFTYERLVTHLEAIPTSEDALPAKEAFLASILPVAVSQLLLAGGGFEARRPGLPSALRDVGRLALTAVSERIGGAKAPPSGRRNVEPHSRLSEVTGHSD